MPFFSRTLSFDRRSSDEAIRSRAAAALILAIAPTLALDGQPAMHDPSTVIEAGGKFYVYATGNGLPAFQSEDGWTWHRAGR